LRWFHIFLLPPMLRSSWCGCWIQKLSGLALMQ
jgi:hypothetical protein